jgi:hypothetical protein|tara:strand:- start:31 stop:795 length:765 start_codon:yes stop_codon:yes gene_type:complete
MSLLDQVETKSKSFDGTVPPVRVNVQGVDGIGKSTFGADAPSSIFIQAEDGLKFIDNVARFPVIESWNQLLTQVKTLIEEPHDYKSVVLDTTDAASKFGEEYVCETNGWNGPQDKQAGYGAFYVAEENAWRKLLQGLNICFEERGMNVILLSHVGDKTIVDPTVGEYHAFQMRSNKKINSLIKDWVDFNLFADYDKSVNDGKPKSHGNRILYTKYAMGFEAKSRLTIPPQLPLEWDAFHKSYLEALAPSETVAA